VRVCCGLKGCPTVGDLDLGTTCRAFSDIDVDGDGLDPRQDVGVLDPAGGGVALGTDPDRRVVAT
jgi:hypothetical protein